MSGRTDREPDGNAAAASASVREANKTGKTVSSLAGCRTKADVALARALLARVKHLPPTRQERVRRVRSALLAGTYEEDGALDEALERLLAECFPEKSR